MDLREPKKKRVGPHIKPQQPFPILIESESGLPVDDELWPLYVGTFFGDSVIVYNQEEMISLYTMGFFGKGSLSRGYPSFNLTKKGIPPIIKERQWKRRAMWMEKLKMNMNTSKDLGVDRPKTLEKSDENEQNNLSSFESGITSDQCMEVDRGEKEQTNSSTTEYDVPSEHGKEVVREEKRHTNLSSSECEIASEHGKEVVREEKEQMNFSSSECDMPSEHNMEVVGDEKEQSSLSHSECSVPNEHNKEEVKSEPKNVCDTTSDVNIHVDVVKTENQVEEGCEVSSSDIKDIKVEEKDNSLVSDSDNQVLVLDDSDSDDIEKVIRDPKPHIEVEHFQTAFETLILTLEEAFFLSYALGCLQVINISGELLSIKDLWQSFCEAKSDFIESYVVYHYFRAKGWVVKSGYKFGGDFLLYKQGPPFYHASYVVLVQKVDSKLKCETNSLTWTKLHGINRLAENSGKDIMICQVVFPNNITTEDLQSPKSLPKFQVNEQLMKRWVSSQERAEKEEI